MRKRCCGAQEAADRLHIKVRTLEKHLQNIQYRLGTNDTVQAITKAERLHLI